MTLSNRLFGHAAAALVTKSAARAAAAAASGLAGSAALAHTGQGHDEYGVFEGLRHALREPDHLAMLALAIVVIGVASPFVLRAALWLGRRIAAPVRRALAARREGAG